MVVFGWVATVLWVLSAVVCFALGQAGPGDGGLPGASPTPRILAGVGEGRPALAWMAGGLSIGMAAVTAICTAGLSVMRRAAAELAGLKADARRDRQERQSDAAAMLQRLSPPR